MKRTYRKQSETLKAKAPKVRDYVHLAEITHGSGAGYHRSAKDYNRRNSRKIERGED